MLNIEEAAQFLNISKTTLRRWTKLGQLACSRVGVKGERRFLLSDLKACISAPSATALSAGNPSDPMALLDAAAARGVPRHVCLHFQGRDQLWEMFRPYVLAHLAQGAPILYIHEEHARADVCARIRAEGYDPEQLERDGLLRLLVPAQAYLRAQEFVPQRMLDFMEASILTLRAAGHETVLISGEMSWCLKGTPGTEKMAEYESLLNKLLLRYPDVTIVCHYDSLRLNGAVTLDALCSHPHVHLPHQFGPGYHASAKGSDSARSGASA